MIMHIVCADCRHVYEDVPGACPSCGSTAVPKEAYINRTLAEAKAAGMWLADGYHMVGFKDPHFKPRR